MKTNRILIWSVITLKTVVQNSWASLQCYWIALVLISITICRALGVLFSQPFHILKTGGLSLLFIFWHKRRTRHDFLLLPSSLLPPPSHPLLLRLLGLHIPFQAGIYGPMVQTLGWLRCPKTLGTAGDTGSFSPSPKSNIPDVLIFLFKAAFFFWKEVSLLLIFECGCLFPIPVSSGTALLLAAKGLLSQGGLFWQGVWIAVVLAPLLFCRIEPSFEPLSFARLPAMLVHLWWSITHGWFRSIPQASSSCYT